MTITIKLPREKGPLCKVFQEANKKAMERLLNNPGFMRFKEEEGKKYAKLAREAAERYAKKHGLTLQYHGKEWTSKAKSGEKVAMPPGYFVVKNGVLHELVCI